jgi:hypothetical protein
VLIALAVIAAAALVVGHVVPQRALLGTALMVFLLKSQIVERTHAELGMVAGAVVVVGSAWGFGAWCSFEDFSLWPGLLFTALVVGGVVGAMTLLGQRGLTQLALRAAPLSAVMAVAMVLSWFFAKRGVVGVVLAAVFVGWSAVSLLLQLASLDDNDDAVGAAANLVDDVGFVAWNSFVLWARVAPDDDGAGAIFGG